EEFALDLRRPARCCERFPRVARLRRDLLGALDLPAFVKTSGSKGLHIVAPLAGDAGFDEVNALGTRVAAHLCRRHPDLATTEFYKKDRGGRLFLDVMRNAPGATLIAPYSLRARAGAPVSAPIEWRGGDDRGRRPPGVPPPPHP